MESVTFKVNVPAKEFRLGRWVCGVDSCNAFFPAGRRQAERKNKERVQYNFTCWLQGWRPTPESLCMYWKPCFCLLARGDSYWYVIFKTSPCFVQIIQSSAKFLMLYFYSTVSDFRPLENFSLLHFSSPASVLRQILNVQDGHWLNFLPQMTL